MVVNHLYYNQPTPVPYGALPTVGRRAKRKPTRPSGNADIPVRISLLDDNTILQALQNIYNQLASPNDQTTNLLNDQLFQEFRRIINAATAAGYQPTHDDDFYQALQHANEVFAAFKTHRMGYDLAAQLTDSNGVLKPFEQWLNDTQSIVSHQCRAWLETEYNTAVIRAHQAADWQQFQREKDILPNLKWMPSTSPNPGADHRPFWNTVLPVDHPFWDQHRPGDRWNCKCSLSATDEPTTPVPYGAMPSRPSNPPSPSTQHPSPTDNPQPGLTGNPGKQAAVFSDDHPYFPTTCRQCTFYNPNLINRLRNIIINHKKDCYHCQYVDEQIMEVREVKKVTKQQKEEARKAVQGTTITNPQFPHEILISRRSIDEWLNQPFKYMEEKAQMLFDIQDVISQSEYVGTNDKHKDKVVQSHIFKTKVKDIDAYIIVQEYIDGNFILHSISDAQDFMKYVKRK